MESAPIMPNRPNRMPPRSITMWLRIAPAWPSAFMPSSAGVGGIEVRVGGENLGHAAGLAGRGHGVGEGCRSEIEIMIAERRRVVSGHGQALQLGAGLLECASEGCADADIADIEHEHRSVGFARPPPFGDRAWRCARCRRSCGRR